MPCCLLHPLENQSKLLRYQGKFDDYSVNLLIIFICTYVIIRHKTSENPDDFGANFRPLNVIKAKNVIK